MRFVSLDYLATTSSSGCLTLFEHQRSSNSLAVKRKWILTPGSVLSGKETAFVDFDIVSFKPLFFVLFPPAFYHSFSLSSPSPALAVKDNEAVVVGEAGSLHVLDLGVGGSTGAKFPPSAGGSSASPKLSLSGADSFSITSVIYLRPLEIITANSSGQLKLWDLRILSSQRSHDSASSAPSKILSMNGQRIGVESLAQHPTQPHLVAAGGDDGLLAIWDLRMDKTPATLLQGHDSPVWDVVFHPNHPDHLFTCSDEGKVLHWDAGSAGASEGKRGDKNKSLFNASTASRGGPLSVGGGGGGGSQSPWISTGSLNDKKSNVVTSSLLPSYFNMPVNSVDVESDILLCGTDAEAVFAIRNLNIH